MEEKTIKIKKLKKAVMSHCIWANQLDFLCDECNSRMKPGGNFQTILDDREYQFCSEKCMEAFVEKWKQPPESN